jgi:hypothetical protein
MAKQVNRYTGEFESHYTEAQMIEYGKAEFERALLLAMNTTRAFGKTGDVIAVIIGYIKREDEK